MTSRDYLTIGEVVQKLQGAYPDLSISKLRFLEEEGLINPERTAGGYRKFTSADVARLEVVLRLQREHFLPLSVIRERLADYDRGKLPPELERSGGPVAEPLPLGGEDEGPLPLEEAPNAIGVPVSFVKEIVDFGLIELHSGEQGLEIARADVPIIHGAWDLRRYGVEPRHLRMYETFAEREAALFSQILMPAFRHKTPESRQKLTETLTELSGLTDDLKSRLLRRSLLRTFEDLS
jgi:DNA-binding transcriptional MerR regulator